MDPKAGNEADHDNALPANLIAQAEAAIVGNTDHGGPSRRASRASQGGTGGINPSPRYPNAQQDSATEAPPAYGDSHDHIELSQDGFDTKVDITDDGRVNININQKSRRLSDLLVPALRNQLKLVAQEAEQRPLPPGYIPPALGGSPGQTPPPRLNVVIHVVGSRGDVQPFVALGKTLKATYGHRIRLATHPTFKTFVEENGLEFFSIGGDPSELMAFMVKNPGLMPGFDSLKSGDVGRRRKGMEEIVLGCWRSCIEAGNGLGAPPRKDSLETGFDAGINMESNPADRPFIADAIIANPPSFAHVHIAEKMGIPLHMMFTMPWSPTQQFPHPLANIQSSNTDVTMENFVSYALVEMMTWQGLGDVINRFREHALGLEPISLIWAPGMLSRLRVPYTYCWSPALIPKPKDWGQHISISGFYFLSLASSFTPAPDLAAYLAAGPPPVYIGFGSIVVDDPNAMTKLIFDAVKKAGIRALVSKGWGGLGADELGIPEGVFMLGNVPHDWLFQHVSAVVHHGGAGTTAAGIATGKPTVVVPFFGDQPFWGAMVARAGAGPAPVPYKQLTADKLAAAITEALKPETLERAKDLGNKIKEEKGNEVGAKSFHDMLDTDKLRCSLAPSRVAVWRIKHTQTRLSAFAANILAAEGLLNFADLKLYRPKEYETEDGPWDPISGGASALLGTMGSMAMGVADFPIEIFRKGRMKKEAHNARKAAKEGSKDSSEGSTPKGPSRSSSQLNVDAEEADTPSTSSKRPVPPSSESTLSPRTSRESTERSSGETTSTSDTALTSTSSFSRPGRENSMKQALRGALDRSRSHSRERANSFKRSISEKRKSIARGESPNRQPKEVEPSNLTMDNAVGAGKGIARIVGAGLKSPMDFTLGIARGFHNAPKLYGDDTVRPNAKVTDFQSGVKAAAKEFGHGMFDGITGLVTQPLRGAEKEGAAGLVKGFGKGIGGLILKPGAAVFAIPGYTFMGIHKEIRKVFGTSVLNYIIAARTAQGFEEAAHATPEERQDVIYRWTTHKSEYQSEKQKIVEAGGPEGQASGHLSPRGFFQTRHLSFEERKKLHEERKAKRIEEHKQLYGKGHKHCPFCRREAPHLHEPRQTQTTAIVPGSPSTNLDREAEFEHAIHASVAATSHGNAEEDLMIERAIRASVRELQSSQHLSDQEALERAIQASVVESGHRQSVGSESVSSDFTKEDAEQQAALEKAIQESLMSYSLSDAQHEEDVKLALQRSIEQQDNPPKAEDIDDALNQAIKESKEAHGDKRKIDEADEGLMLAIQKSKEEMLKHKTEEDIVMEYVKKQSLAEAEHKAAKGKEAAAAIEPNESKADEEALKQAIEASLKDADGASGSGS